MRVFLVVRAGGRKRLEEYVSLETLCVSKAAAKATDMKSRDFCIFYRRTRESRPHIFVSSRGRNADLNKLHTHFSHTSIYRDVLLLNAVKLKRWPESTTHCGCREGR